MSGRRRGLDRLVDGGVEHHELMEHLARDALEAVPLARRETLVVCGIGHGQMLPFVTNW